MARRQRDYRAEERRRNELARQRGFSNRSELRRATTGRDYTAERRRADELARERGYRNKYDQTKQRKRRRIGGGQRPHTIIDEAMLWASYRILFPNEADRTEENAAEFLSGFGSMGATGEPNRKGGFVADAQQRADRDHFVRRYVVDSSVEAFGERYELGGAWWDVWREEYADKYL